jgi:hypothetical protein
MVSELFFSQLALIALLWLCCMLHWVWPSDHPTVPAPRPPPTPPRRMRAASRHPVRASPQDCTATPGYTRVPPPTRPCSPTSAPQTAPVLTRFARLVMTRGRRRQIDTAHQFCPNPACAYRGWVGWGNLRANGHPNGGPWRQLLCVACHRPALTASTALAAALQVCGEHAAGRHAGGQPRRSAASRPRFPAARAPPQRVWHAHQALRTSDTPTMCGARLLSRRPRPTPSLRPPSRC